MKMGLHHPMGRILRVPWRETPSIFADETFIKSLWDTFGRRREFASDIPEATAKARTLRGESGDAMATDHRAALLPFAAALLVLVLAGGAAADDASSSDDAGSSRTPGCSNKFQLVMALLLPLAHSIHRPSSLIRSLPAVVGFGVPGVL